MIASAAVVAFPSDTAPRPRFGRRDRNAIVGAAMSMSPTWAASFYLDDAGTDLASIGPFSAGHDEPDRWGFAMLDRGRIELMDALDPDAATIHTTVSGAVDAMSLAMARQDV